MIESPRIFSSESELPKGVKQIDVFDGALRELFFVVNPQQSKKDSNALWHAGVFATESKVSPVWVYYPWLSIAMKIPDENTYFQLRTARNRDLITDREQSAFRDATLSIAGLSVGSNALSALVATGGPKHIRIADPDTLEITNLNRIQATLPQVGMNKSLIAAQKAWEIDPFLKIEVFDALTEKNIETFIEGTRVFIDEMDSIPMKIYARKFCREHKIPVVMATDNGDGAILDVERFDLEPTREIFHGRVSIDESELKDIDRAKFVQLANQIIDENLFSHRQRESVHMVGSQLSGVPQLGTAAAIAGAAAAYAARAIILWDDLPSGRYKIELRPA